ncbi:MAG TPA: hypothetical protein VKD72_28510 [Gemmataceae bacterium]|nr:hypothetical protein [Gemmataceae bacterium]
MCRLFGVSRSSFYAWSNRAGTATAGVSGVTGTAVANVAYY